MSKYYALVTDYEASGQDLVRKLEALRAAFPDFEILVSVNGSEEYHKEVGEACSSFGEELLPPPDISGLEAYANKIEIGYIGIIDLLREASKRDLAGAVYIEADLWPIHKKVAERVKERLSSVDCVCYPRSYEARMSGFLGDPALIKAWRVWLGRTEAIQSPNFILGLSKKAIDAIIDEIDNTPEGQAFMRTFKEVTRRHSTDASKYLSELLFTTILKKRGFAFGPTWDDAHDPERNTITRHDQFYQRLGDPAVYFMHGFKKNAYPEQQSDYIYLLEFWGVVPSKEISIEDVTLETEFPVQFGVGEEDFCPVKAIFEKTGDEMGPKSNLMEKPER